jgi:uncharacterized membrane protein YbhN (UPF0104 family)
MNKRLRTILQYCFFLGLGIFLAWWSLKDLTTDNKSQIKEALKTAKYWLLIPVFAILYLSHFIRGLRWRLLIQSLGYNPSKLNCFFAVMIGYLTNQAVPRLGEVVKCTMLARYEKIPADKLIGTIILERIIDAITLLIIFGITIVIQPDIYSQLTDAIFNPEQDPAHKTISSTLILLIVVAIVIIAIVIWMIKTSAKEKTIYCTDNYSLVALPVWWLSWIYGVERNARIWNPGSFYRFISRQHWHDSHSWWHWSLCLPAETNNDCLRTKPRNCPGIWLDTLAGPNCCYSHRWFD